ncbi:MmcQ/YjbR family DNA-binding protein [Aestuariimicrobium soli]|uniref:MmcQ/YjbR family DNA-binding protein n=1 Tax=Aestuariimicrobium soli TaxID=2035834 RepID=UPI003EBA92A7
MAHPARYTADDPYLVRLREICLSLPGASEKESHGRPVFCTTKVFAIFGATVKGDHWDDRWAQAVVVLPDADERAALLAQSEQAGDGRVFVPAYHGPSGWIGLNLAQRPADQVDWREVAELVELSYRRTAGTRLVAELDRQAGQDK